VRQELERLLESMKTLSPVVRQYEAYRVVRDTVQEYAPPSPPHAACVSRRGDSHVKAQPLVFDLAQTATALRDRHWAWLMKRLRVQWSVSDLNLVPRPRCCSPLSC
jgi:hypothetical protein